MTVKIAITIVALMNTMVFAGCAQAQTVLYKGKTGEVFDSGARY